MLFVLVAQTTTLAITPTQSYNTFQESLQRLIYQPMNVTSNQGMTLPIVPYPTKAVPVDISYLGLKAELGDIIFSTTYPTYVALNSREALFLDFNMNSPVYAQEPPVYTGPSEVDYAECAGYITDVSIATEHDLQELIQNRRQRQVTNCVTPFSYDYQIVGKVDWFIIGVLKSNYEAVWKQFIIWKYLGVEESGLRTAWIRDFGRGQAEYNKLSNTLEFLYAAKFKIGKTLDEAEKLGLVNVDLRADGYSSIEITAWGNKEVALNIPIGQTFENIGGKGQNLATGEPVLVFLPQGLGKIFRVDAYCINAHRAIPTQTDEFKSGKIVDQNVKEEILTGYIGGIASSGAAQSAVWSETDGNGNDASQLAQSAGISASTVEWASAGEVQTGSEQPSQEPQTQVTEGVLAPLYYVIASVFPNLF